MFGGVANYWANLCRCLPAEDLVVLAPEYDNSLDFDIKQNYLIYRKNLLTKNKWLWPKWLPFLFSAFWAVRREKIQKVIVAQVLPGGTIAYILKKHYKIPYIVSFHGLDIAFAKQHKRKLRLMKKIISQAQKIIVNSEFTKNKILELGACAEDKIEIIYPCPNIKMPVLSSKYQQLKEEIISSHNLKDKKILLTVGRLVERKGHDQVLQALAQIIKKIPKLMYLIVGNGPQKKKLKELIAKNNLSDNVKLLDDVMDYELPVYYNLCDVFIMPSRQLANGDVEGFGIVYLEANTFGKPVIAGKSGGAVEAVKHNYNGLLVDPKNLNDIAQAVVSLLENPQKAVILGQNGKKRVAEVFCWRNQAVSLLKILD